MSCFDFRRYSYFLEHHNLYADMMFLWTRVSVRSTEREATSWESSEDFYGQTSPAFIQCTYSIELICFIFLRIEPSFVHLALDWVSMQDVVFEKSLGVVDVHVAYAIEMVLLCCFLRVIFITNKCTGVVNC